MAPEPKVLRITRPYHSVSEYLQGDGWTLKARTVILIGTDPIPVGTVLRCDVVLTTGQAVLRFEGVVDEHIERHKERPSGSRVRIRRMARSSQHLLRRVLSERKERTLSSSSPPPGDSVLARSVVSDSLIPEPIESMVPPPSSAAFEHPEMAPPKLGSLEAPTAVVQVPADREALLERLRTRTAQLARTDAREPDSAEKTG